MRVILKITSNPGEKTLDVIMDVTSRGTAVTRQSGVETATPARRKS